MAQTKKQKEDHDLRMQVGSIDQTQREVILPSLKRVEDSIVSLVEKDYITEEKADKRYATKEEVKQMKVLFWGIITAVMIGLINFVFKFLERGLR